MTAPTATKTAQSLDDLKAVKALSDARNYEAKHVRLSALIRQHVPDFFIDSELNNTWGITHRPTNFRFHLPKEVIADITDLQNDSAGAGTKIKAKAIEKNDDATAPDTYKVAAFIIKKADPDLLYITLEVADSPAAQQVGLMFRNHVPDNYGMFFKTASSFWMKNCFVGLDIAFLDKSGTILEIQNMKPHTETPHQPLSKAACFSVEFGEGWLARNGVGVGDVIA